MESGDLDLTGHWPQVDMEVRQLLLLQPLVLKVITLVVFVRRHLLQARWEVFKKIFFIIIS